MFDLFNRKRIRELEAHIENLQQICGKSQAREAELKNQIEYLIRTIRQMDAIIFSMGQCSSWESMRPRFNQLHDQMTARKVVESNRINDLVRGELVKTYNGQTNIRQIESKA